MMRRAFHIALLWAFAAAAMNTNSLSVYCPPPTNLTLLASNELYAVRYDRAISATNLARMAAVYDMMCERIDVPSSNFVYSADKRGLAFEQIGTNRSAISASRILKYNPLTEWCDTVDTFLSTGSVTVAGAFNIHPLTLAPMFDSHYDNWIDVVDGVGPYTLNADTVLSPGRGNYRYKYVWGRWCVREYYPSNSIIPILEMAMGRTHCRIPQPLFGAGSTDAMAGYVSPWDVPFISSPTAAELMNPEVPRIPYLTILAQPEYLVSRLNHSWYHVDGIIFTNDNTTIIVDYLLTAAQVYGHVTGSAPLPMENGRIDLTSAYFLDPRTSVPLPAPQHTATAHTAPIYSVKTGVKPRNSLSIHFYCTGTIVRPGIDPSAIPEEHWVLVDTKWDDSFGTLCDFYEYGLPCEFTITATNSYSVSGEIAAQVTHIEVQGVVGTTAAALNWPTADAARHGYYSGSDCAAFLFGSCSYMDDMAVADDSDTDIYDLYGRMDSGKVPATSVTNLLTWYARAGNMPRELKLGSPVDPKVFVTITTDVPSPDAAAVVHAVVPYGESPSSMWARYAIDPSPSEGQSSAVTLVTTATLEIEGGTNAEVTYAAPVLFGFVKWNFLEMGLDDR